MAAPQNKTYFIASLLFHLVILLVLILSFDFAAPLVVVENTNKRDVISAVILGDTQKSKILTQQSINIPPRKEAKVEPPKPKPVPQAETKKEVIPLKVTKKKTPPIDMFKKDLLADLEKINKQNQKQKKLQQKQLKAHFEKTLRQQAEKTMRQQLLNEDIKVSGAETHESQGIINKYQALIQQAISEHWIIPSQSNKKAYSLLLIRLAPGGVVLDVQIIKSSGDPALDNSARAAVFKASPLPVPSDVKEFGPFREFNLKAKPENIVNNDSGLG